MQSRGQRLKSWLVGERQERSTGQRSMTGRVGEVTEWTERWDHLSELPCPVVTGNRSLQDHCSFSGQPRTKQLIGCHLSFQERSEDSSQKWKPEWHYWHQLSRRPPADWRAVRGTPSHAAPPSGHCACTRQSLEDRDSSSPCSCSDRRRPLSAQLCSPVCKLASTWGKALLGCNSWERAVVDRLFQRSPLEGSSMLCHLLLASLSPPRD